MELYNFISISIQFCRDAEIRRDLSPNLRFIRLTATSFYDTRMKNSKKTVKLKLEDWEGSCILCWSHDDSQNLKQFNNIRILSDICEPVFKSVRHQLPQRPLSSWNKVCHGNLLTLMYTLPQSLARSRITSHTSHLFLSFKIGGLLLNRSAMQCFMCFSVLTGL